jgi:hypothetical protein
VEHRQPCQAGIAKFTDLGEIKDVGMVATLFQLAGLPKVEDETHIKTASDRDL